MKIRKLKLSKAQFLQQDKISCKDLVKNSIVMLLAKQPSLKQPIWAEVILSTTEKTVKKKKNTSFSRNRTLNKLESQNIIWKEPKQ